MSWLTIATNIKHQFEPLFSYDDNIENLRRKVEVLGNNIDELELRVEEAKRNSGVIRDDVRKWLERASIRKVEGERILEEEERIGKGCLEVWCLELKTRFLLSKKALKMAQDLDAFFSDGEFESVAHPKVPLGIVSTMSTGASSSSAPHVPGTSGGLKSRLLIMENVMKALEDDKIRMIRICGMGGVGKTTMVKEVEEKLRETKSAEPLFHEIARVEFTENPDVKSIQGQMAEWLGLKFEEETLEIRAKRLYWRLNDKSKRILVILDNVWRSEDLVKVGIPLKHTSCKVLLTSRREDVCADTRSQKMFRLGVLPDEEARILFQDMVGESLYDNFQIAENIVKKCAGLPIAISTAAKALSNKGTFTWKNLLRKLEKSDFQGEYKDVFAILKVSYDFLQTEELKDFFLLSCLFPEGFDVPIEDLVRYGLGLKLFGKIEKVYEARNAAHEYVENLMKSNLLLSSDRNGCVKVHDLVREFALLIASEGLFMVKLGHGLTAWPGELTDNNYTRISLQWDKHHNLPGGLECPKLELLKLVGEIHTLQFPVNFYGGMSELNVLAFSRMLAPLLPASLKNLRTLSLNYCTLKGLTLMFCNPENLEVLSLADSFIEDLPQEIKSLSRLRILDLTRCRELTMIPSGALGCLKRLEELYMRDTKLLVKAQESVDRFRELRSLPNFVVIDMDIPHMVLLVPSFLQKLEKFKISISLDKWEKPGFGKTYKLETDAEQVEYQFPNTLTVVAPRIGPLEGIIKALRQKAEVIHLQGDGSIDFFHKEEIMGLLTNHEAAEIRDSFTVNSWKNFLNEEEISDSFNLKTLSLESCNEFVCLVNTTCLEQKSVFPVLESLYLDGLHFLEDIYHIQHSEESTSRIILKSKQPAGWGPAQLASFGKLRVLDVRNCERLETIFSVSIASGLAMLEKIQIVGCASMEEVFLKNQSTAVDKIEFPRLKHLLLDDLPSLVSFCDAADSVELPQLVHLELRRLPELKTLASLRNDASSGHPLFNKKIAFTSLEHLEISEMNSKELWSNDLPDWYFQEGRKIRLIACPELLAVFSSHFIQRLNHLEELHVSKCDSLEVVFDLKELIVGGEGHKVVFINRLGTLRLSYLIEMKHVWKNCSRGFEGFQSLTILEIYKCHSLKYLFSPLIAKVLVNLRLLEIHDCKLLEEVVSERDEGADEEKTDDVIFFPMLDKLLLKSLPCLERLGTKDEGADEEKTDDMIFFPMLDKLLLKSLPHLERFGPRAYAFGRPSSRAPAIGPSETQNQDKRDDSTASAALEGIAQHQLPHWALGKPKYMQVLACHNLLEVVSSNLILAVPQLEEMKLDFLENLMYIGRVEHCRVLSFENLKTLSINRCNKLSYLFSSSVVKSLVQLTDLCVSHCMIIEVIVKEEDEAEAEAARMSTHVLPCLQSIKLERLPNLKGMCLAKNDFESITGIAGY